jgi:hypothetical protein
MSDASGAFAACRISQDLNNTNRLLGRQRQRMARAGNEFSGTNLE